MSGCLGVNVNPRGGQGKRKRGHGLNLVGAPMALVASSSSVPTMASIAARSLRNCRAGADLVILSPSLTACVQRFGVYATDEITLIPPDAYDTHLGLDLPATG